MRNVFSKFMPFFVLGLVLVILIAGLVLLSYLLIFGALLGGVLFIIGAIREKFFTSKQLVKPSPRARQGETINHEDIK